MILRSTVTLLQEKRRYWGNFRLPYSAASGVRNEILCVGLRWETLSHECDSKSKSLFSHVILEWSRDRIRRPPDCTVCWKYHVNEGLDPWSWRTICWKSNRVGGDQTASNEKVRKFPCPVLGSDRLGKLEIPKKQSTSISFFLLPDNSSYRIK